MQSEYGSKMAQIKFVAVLLFLSTLSAHAQKIDLTSGAQVEFDAVGKPSMINIKGTGAKATGALSSVDNNLVGEFIVNLKDFTTDMDLRDEHMKEKYLEVEKKGFDKAILKINQKITSILPTSGAWEPQGLTGLLTLHGVTKEVPLNCKLTVKDSRAVGAVNFKIKVQDYKIDIPSFAGITMTDEVAVKVLVDHKVVP